MKTSPTLQMCEDYVREKDLLVDPQFFFNYYEANEWHDKDDTKVKRWKGKMWTWHRRELQRGGARPCGRSGCKKPGVYIHGQDRDGHPHYWCIDHKPIVKPVLPKSLTDGIFKRMEPEPNINTKRNKALEKLAKAERAKQ